ncbi:MAG TPA: DNA repair protein RecO [Bacillota bacterium]|nr:DNA repair protein RecO [Bacillota bacterium]HPF42758.1 DNA repair protein RecO [Bacillota bacterium]HPJ85974.1 DNA repair protein RecO [Bacillota bacterium]HPQ62005.1 DNA repair protein RecO [Bacillota bacterium]
MTETTGFVLKRMDYKETSKIIFVYTPTGRESYLVHGANKFTSPFLAQAEILNLLNVKSEGKGLKTAKNIETKARYPHIKDNLEKYTYALHLFEILQNVADAEIDHAKLFGFMEKLLPKMEESDNYIPYAYMFESKLLYLLGIQPEFRECVVCKSKEVAGFSVPDGGMLCQEHYRESCYPLTLAREWMRLYYFDINKEAEPPLLSYDTAVGLRRLLDDYYRYHLNMRTKSRQVLEGLLGY